MKVFCLFASVFLAASVAQAQTGPKLDTSVRNAAKIIPSVDLGQIIDTKAREVVAAAAPSGGAAGPEAYFNAAAGKTLSLRSLVWRYGGQEITLDKVVFAADGTYANVYVCHGDSKYVSNPDCVGPFKITPASPSVSGTKIGGSYSYESVYTSTVRVDAGTISFDRKFSKSGEWQGEGSISVGVGYFPIESVLSGVTNINNNNVFVGIAQF